MKFTDLVLKFMVISIKLDVVGSIQGTEIHTNVDDYMVKNLSKLIFLNEWL